jgi:non-canonical purine NTP pyrophosphatase (RdgB/HAM1 family)
MKNITFVTSNANKVREAEQVLGVDLKRKSIELEEIQSMDLKEIVGYKVKQAYKKLKQPVLAEDTGLYLDGWNGFPGPFIKWIKDVMGYDVFPKSIPQNKRGATWVTVYGYFDGKQLVTFEGKTKGSIALKPRGTDGWGFDVLFIPAGKNKTTAELGSIAKPKFSARYKALRKVKKYLNTK